MNPCGASANMDRQDKQDKKLLQTKLTRSMIGCALEVIHEPGSGFLESLISQPSCNFVPVVDNSFLTQV